MSKFNPKIIFNIDYNDNTTDTIVAMNDLKNLSLTEEQYVDLIDSIQTLLQDKLKVFIKTDEILD